MAPGMGSNQGDTWLWHANELHDNHGGLLAVVRSDVIYTDDERILVEYSPGPLRFSCRATTADGEVITVRQPGLTISRLDAHCGDRTYELARRTIWRKEREIRLPDPNTGSSRVAVVVRPKSSGDVEVVDGEGSDLMPLRDAIVLSWACVLVDAPVRRPRAGRR